MVPGVGIEPTLPKEPDFESGASANSATRARVRETRNGSDWAKGKPEMRKMGWVICQDDASGINSATIPMSIIKPLVQIKFNLTSRSRASDQIRKVADQYLDLAQKVDETSGAEGVRVPKMIGVDEDMRNWSFYMLLEHNEIGRAHV